MNVNELISKCVFVFVIELFLMVVFGDSKISHDHFVPPRILTTKTISLFVNNIGAILDTAMLIVYFNMNKAKCILLRGV